MKYQILLTVGLLALVSTSVQAGTEKFDSSSFNQLIDNDLRAQQDLQNDLRKTAGIKADEAPNTTKKIIKDDGASNYFVETRDFPSQKTPAKSDANQDMRRVAQEFKSLE